MSLKTHIILASGLALFAISSTAADHPRSNTPTASSAAQGSTTDEQKSEILALFDTWNASLATGNPEAVAAHYAEDAILLPTLSAEVREDQASRIDYFTYFMGAQPQGELDETNVRVFGDTAINSGIYTFTFNDGTSAQARYTFVYQQQDDGEWLIVEHHSSLLPG